MEGVIKKPKINFWVKKSVILFSIGLILTLLSVFYTKHFASPSICEKERSRGTDCAGYSFDSRGWPLPWKQERITGWVGDDPLIVENFSKDVVVWTVIVSIIYLAAVGFKKVKK